MSNAAKSGDPQKGRWKKYGVRYLVRDAKDYQARIFGASLPHDLWAWAVWGHQSSAEGVEFSLRSARTKADIAIEKVKEATRER